MHSCSRQMSKSSQKGTTLQMAMLLLTGLIKGEIISGITHSILHSICATGALPLSSLTLCSHDFMDTRIHAISMTSLSRHFSFSGAGWEDQSSHLFPSVACLFLRLRFSQAAHDAGINCFFSKQISQLSSLKKKAFVLINFICIISSAINSTWHEEKLPRFHSNHE